MIVPSFKKDHAPYDPHRELASQLQEMGAREGINFAKIRDIYPTYEYEDLAKHPAAVIIPYQVSFMLFFELYRMAIPLFVPSPELLIKWHFNDNILCERTWNGINGRLPKGKSDIPRHVMADELDVLVEDPNNELDRDSILKWIRYSDFYEMPYVTQFNSFDELVRILKNSIGGERLVNEGTLSVDFRKISGKMLEYINVESDRVSREWDLIIKEIKESRKYSNLKQKLREGTEIIEKETDSGDINDALRKHYGISLNMDSCWGSRVEKSMGNEGHMHKFGPFSRPHLYRYFNLFTTDY